MTATIFFDLAAVVTLLGAVMVLVLPNTLRAAMALILALGGLSVVFLMLHAEFVAVMQLLVYAGAIMVLFVFVIMLLNAGVEEQTKGSRVALLFGVPGMLIGSLLVAWVVLRHSGTEAVAAGAMPGPPKAIGNQLFHEFLLPFEITSILILIAIMGAVVLASKPTVPGGGPAKKVND